MGGIINGLAVGPFWAIWQYATNPVVMGVAGFVLLAVGFTVLQTQNEELRERLQENRSK